MCTRISTRLALVHCPRSSGCIVHVVWASRSSRLGCDPIAVRASQDHWTGTNRGRWRVPRSVSPVGSALEGLRYQAECELLAPISIAANPVGRVGREDRPDFDGSTIWRLIIEPNRSAQSGLRPFFCRLASPPERYRAQIRLPTGRTLLEHLDFEPDPNL